MPSVCLTDVEEQRALIIATLRKQQLGTGWIGGMPIGASLYIWRCREGGREMGLTAKQHP